MSRSFPGHARRSHRALCVSLTTSWILTLTACGALDGAGGDGMPASGTGSQGSGASGGRSDQANGGGGSGSGSGGVPAQGSVASYGLTSGGLAAYYRVVRLTHAQWENAVTDLLDLATAPGRAGNFIPDPPNGTFSNNERALYVTDSLRLDYQRAAEEIAAQVSQGAALFQRWGNEPAQFIRGLGQRAFRRALEEEEASRYEALWAQGAQYFGSGDDAADGARIFVEALLQSPNFLYRWELAPEGERLSGSELATKLSFALRDTIPDEELLAAADAGELDTDAGLAAIAEKMVKEDEAAGVMENFHDELFGLSRYHSILKNQRTFPSYSEALNQLLFDADRLFFSALFASDSGVRAILTSPVAYANSAIDEFYGISVASDELVQVELDADRPGFLTRVGFLAYNANLSETDPIHRGVDINNRILCADLSPPPGEIPPLPPSMPGQTNRQRVTAHTGEGICAGCHGTLINPPGFALEGFDAMGQVRLTDNGLPLDTTGTYGLLEGDGGFDGIVDLAQKLANSQRVHACYASHVMEYALSRDLGEEDLALLETMTEASVAGDVSIRELLGKAVASPRFTTVNSVQP